MIGALRRFMPAQAAPRDTALDAARQRIAQLERDLYQAIADRQVESLRADAAQAEVQRLHMAAAGGTAAALDRDLATLHDYEGMLAACRDQHGSNARLHVRTGAAT